MIERKGIDYSKLIPELLPKFKAHIRVNHSLEDESIGIFLAGAMDAIGHYADIDIFPTNYSLYVIEDEPVPHVYGRYTNTTRQNIKNVIFVDKDGNDILGNIDSERGYVFPLISNGDILTFSAGYDNAAEIEPNLLSIIFRYAAHLYENREAINIGEPKHLPDWVNYALPSIWKSRI